MDGKLAALARLISFKEIRANDVIGDARSASAAKGEALFDASAEWIVRDLATLKL